MIKTPSERGHPFSTVLLETLAKAKAERERQGQARARDFEATVELVQRAVQPIDADTLAAKIIKAGQLRRAEIADDRLLPKRGSVAWQILQAARKARNEDPL